MKNKNSVKLLLFKYFNFFATLQAFFLKVNFKVTDKRLTTCFGYKSKTRFYKFYSNMK